MQYHVNTFFTVVACVPVGTKLQHESVVWCLFSDYNAVFLVFGLSDKTSSTDIEQSWQGCKSYTLQGKYDILPTA